MMKTLTDFDAIQRGVYGLIHCDPPWSFKTYSAKGHGKSPQKHYRCMSLDDIKALPVASLAAPDCVLFLWTTCPMVFQAQDVIRAWGFNFSTTGFWHKKTVNGKTAFGPGYTCRNAADPWLIGIRGKPKHSKSERNVIEGLAREHSRKPEEAYAWCERYMPGVRRIDLFSRQARPGWDVWGDQTDYFEPVNSLGLKHVEHELVLPL